MSQQQQGDLNEILCHIPMKQSLDRHQDCSFHAVYAHLFRLQYHAIQSHFSLQAVKTTVASTSHEFAGQTHQPTRTSSTPTAHVHLQRHLARLLDRRLLVG